LPTINEQQMLRMLDGAKSVLLLEPNYSRKYLPLGLAKIATYISGKQFVYHRYYKSYPCDLVCISSLFTYDLPQVLLAISEVRSYDQHVPIIVGGICASLIPEMFPEGINVFVGTSDVLDQCVPDYQHVDWEIASPWNEFSFTFTSRGCPNKCAYCGVWRLEPNRHIVSNWREHIVASKQYAMISDNNISSFPTEHVCNVANYLCELGKQVIIDNGLDPKHVTPKVCVALARVSFYKEGLRLSFDRLSEKEVFTKAIQMLIDAGVRPSSIMSYCIFNFHDTFDEAFYRAATCVKLGIRPFPQHFVPLDTICRDVHFIGKYWSLPLIKAFGYYWRSMSYVTTSFRDFLITTQGLYGLSQQDKDTVLDCKQTNVYF